MTDNLCSSSINDLISGIEDKKVCFIVPSYQRGYRWEKQQVIELLDDILDFSENKEDQDYYCLQPVVVRKLSLEDIETYNLENENGKEWYEVIDRQQRLTTLDLILHYFNEQFIW